MQKIKFSEAINSALEFSLKKDKSLIVYGLGVTDPKKIFNTTVNLKKKFGNKRVFDIPNSENALTGIGIGHALNGGRTVFTHQRLDFSFLSLDQIINNAAKIFYTSDGKFSVPITIRLIVGRGWGQGPNHSQALQSMYAHIPGLKVVCISNPKNAKGILLSSIEDKNPVIIFEHRWLHEIKDFVPKKYYKTKLGKAEIIKKGKHITLISSSYMTIECLRCAEILKKYSIHVEIVDLQSLRPLDIKTIMKSVKKTKKALVVDNGGMMYGISSEIISKIHENLNSSEKNKFLIKRIGISDNPIPSTRSLAKYCYPTYDDLVDKVNQMLEIKLKIKNKLLSKNIATDQPNLNFTGPF